ncbi:hypothetical protein AB3S75_029176 [Citrus x aurantiifolia]
MSASINFSGQAQAQRLCFRALGGNGIILNSLPSKISCQLKQNTSKIEHHGISIRSLAKCKPSTLVPSASDDSIEIVPFSASNTIREFYACINEKSLKRLETYISDDCCFEDCSFPKPFQGKKEVMQFLEQLMTSMGLNVKFSVEQVCEGDEFTAGINWHLEWKGRLVPFTRGCSFYECSLEGETLLIKKARVVIESPIKPGGIVLTLLKNLTSLSDDFPKATEWLLNSPHVISTFLLKAYTLFLAPFVRPILAGYINMWNFIARLLGLAFNILINILKIFSK